MVLPIIVEQPKSTVAEVCGIATFKCTISSYGNTSIIWRRWNSELPITAKVTNTISMNKIRSTLIIEKNIGYNKGYYYCLVANIVGMISSKFAYLNITGKYFIII